MRFAVLGTGIVGRTVGGKLVTLGHEVTMGSRRADHPDAVAWAAAAGENARVATFADAAAAGEMVVNATMGMATMEVLKAAGAEKLGGKVLVDISNPLDFSRGFPPSLSIVNTGSLAEQIQSAYPDVRVVKTLNTMSAPVMVEPSLVPGHHNVFVSGNDSEARTQVSALLQTFGWPAEDIIELGDITTARGAEMYLPLWVRLFGVIGTPHFNVNVVRG
ncbi:MAG: NADPH-dependent F420 reductase [Candidatus Dormibacteria bacterium]